MLSEEIVEQALTAVGIVWNDGIYTPLVTLWVFLGQVLRADQSCRAAVARLLAFRVSQGLRPCFSETSAYCQASLPKGFFSAVTCAVERALDDKVDPEWIWKGRRVYMFDGTTVSMTDTPANRNANSKTYNQKPGLGLTLMDIRQWPT